MSFLSSADKLLELCRVIDSSGSPKLALPVAKKAYDIQMMVRQKLRERTKLQAFVNLTTQERERHKRLKKDLSAERLSELATQHQVSYFITRLIVLRSSQLSKCHLLVPVTTRTSTLWNNRFCKSL